MPRRYSPAGIDVHETLSGIRRRVDVRDLTSFCVVRNPWARIFSFWQHKRRRGDADLPRGTFADVMRSSNCLLLQPQLWWMRDERGEIRVDRILTFEQLPEQFQDLAEDFGLDAELPHLNRSNADDYRAHYDDYSWEIVHEFYRPEIDAFEYRF